MRKKLAFIVLTLALFSTHDLQGQWRQAFYNGNTETDCFASDSLGLFAGTSHGVLLSTDHGETWNYQHDWGGAGGTPSIYALAALGTNLFAAIGDYFREPGRGILRSTDEGYSWTPIGFGLTDSYVTSLVVIGTTIFAGTSRGGGVFRSTDSGEHWIQVKNGLAHDTVSRLVASGANLYAAAQDGLYLSTNNGDTWTSLDVTNISDGLTEPWEVTALGVSDSELIAGFYQIRTGSQGMFFSLDNGASWKTPDSLSLPSGAATFDVTGFVIDGSNIFLSASDAVSIILLSTDSGMNWHSVTQGQPHRVDALTISGPNIVAGSGVGGIWVAALSDLVGSNSVAQTSSAIFNISSNPDPATSRTAISFTLPEAGAASLAVTDVAGRETPLLHSAWLAAGPHEVTWDASEYPSGVYLCRLTAGGESVTRRVVVMH